jgi:biotin synthesis protein BioG
MECNARYHWVRKEGGQELRMFFSGWGLGPGCWQHLDATDKDLLVVYDYGAEENMPDISGYENIEVIGYSMGVLMATYFMEKISMPEVRFLLAVNGTSMPFSAAYGLSPQQVQDTVDHMSPGTFNAFLMGVAGEKHIFRKILPHAIPFDNSHLQASLLYCLEVQNNTSQVMPWNAVLLGKNDLIFPFEGMRQFWNNYGVKTVVLDNGHFPFFQWGSWIEMLSFSEKNV